MTLKQRLGKWLYPRLPISRSLFDLLRGESNSFLTKVQNAVLPWRRARLRKIRAGTHLRVNVACGPHVLPGFVNLDLFPCCPDVVAWDCRKSLPRGDMTGARATPCPVS